MSGFSNRAFAPLFMALSIAGCGGIDATSGDRAAAGSASGGAGAPSQAAAGPALNDPFFVTPLRQADYGIYTEDVMVPVRGGTHVSCKLARPARPGSNEPAEGRFPGVISAFLVYSAINTVPDFLVERGYNSLSCDYPGSGNSPGTFSQFDMASTLANYDVIEWFAAQPWSTGKIGQMGTSFGGHSTNLVARLNPPHLVAVIPNSSMSDWYSNTIYHGGIRNGSILYQPVMIGLTGCIDQNHRPAGSCLQVTEGITQDELVEYGKHPLFDAYWKERSVEPYYDAYRAAALTTDGWNDRYKGGGIRNYQALKKNMWLLMGPWTHSAYDGGDSGTLDPQVHQLAWFDYWLKGDGKATLPAARITSFEMPNDGTSTGWYQFPDWPAPQAAEYVAYLTPDKKLASSPASDASTLDWIANGADVGDDPASEASNLAVLPAPFNSMIPVPAAPTQTLADMMPYRLTFTAAPESEDLILAGNPEVVVSAAFKSSDENIVARLMEVAPDGTVRQISTGWLKASHYKGHDHLEKIVPGEFYRMKIALGPTHWRIKAGRSLRVSFSSGDVPDAIYDQPAGGGVTLRFNSATRLTVHVMRDATAKGYSLTHRN